VNGDEKNGVIFTCKLKQAAQMDGGQSGIL
jgi:hypothetical protein